MFFYVEEHCLSKAPLRFFLTYPFFFIVYFKYLFLTPLKSLALSTVKKKAFTSRHSIIKTTKIYIK